MPLILPGNVATALGGVFEVANSVRMDGSSAYMHKTASSGGSQRKFTLSFWAKRCDTGETHVALSSFGDGSNYVDIRFKDNDTFRIYEEASGSTALELVTNRLFRDTSAWYHIVIAVDTTQGTAANRVKLYVNGTQETSFGTETYPSQNRDIVINESDTRYEVGDYYDGSTRDHYFNGYLAEYVFIDGTQYAASDFGEFDEDSPTIWKPKDVSGLTFGTNGFYLDFEASGNLGNDANGGTDLTEAGLAATDQTTDTCTNNFCTINPLDNQIASSTFSEGNCKVVTSGGNDTYNTSTFWLSAGKWYWEIKVGTGTGNDLIGIASSQTNSTSLHLGENTFGYGYRNGGAGDVRYNNSAVGGWSGTDYGNGDIIMVALDLTNSKLYFGVNGTWDNSGDPTTGSTGTGAVSIVAAGSTPQGVYSPAAGEWHNANSFTYEANFGNPPYANSSSAADANGYGAFEYAPPSGYLALCTKNLGSDGG